MATYYLDYEGGDDYRCEQSPYERGVLTAQNMGADVAGRFGIAANFTGAGSGSTAALFTGTSLANVSIPANTPFCLETFVQFTSNNAAADQTAMGFWSSAAGNLGWRLGTTSSGQLALQYTTGGTTVITVGGAYTPTTGVWVHLCAERDVSNVIKVYAAGVQIATATDSSAFFASTLAFVIGNINSAFNAKFPGYVDSCRVTIGKTRYGAAFTPPTGAFGVGGMSNDSLWNYVAMLYTFSGDGTGTSFANRWKTFTLGATAARIAPGDTVRVMASPEPTSLGNATWTNLSNTVTLATMATAVVEGATSATGFAWTGLANVTVSGDTNGYKNGPSGVQFVFASAFTTGLAAYVRRIDESADVAAHRYWRLLFLSTNSVDTQAAEVEMRESTGGVDATGSGTASASSVFSSPTWDAANAFDNNNATAWNSSGFASPTYLAYDFGVGVTKNIKEISLRVRSDFINNAPISFQIQYSDDNSTWTTSWTVTGQTGWTFSEARVFTKPTVSIAPIDLSAYQQVSFWLYTNTAITAGEFSLRLCSDTAGATVVNNLPIPAISLVNAWVPITIDNGSALGSNINSVALYADADPGTTTLHLNTIIACKAPSAADSLNFHSLIGKVCNLSWAATTAYSLNDERRPTQTNRNGFRYRVTTAGTSGSSEPVWPDILTGTVTDGSVVWTCYEVEDTWYALRNISGTTLTLDGAPSATTGTVVARGYSGVTETVATYKREPVLAAIQTDFNATINAVNDSGTTSSLITFEGGWDRSAMSSKSGESWTSGRTGYGWGVGSPGSQVNFELNNLHMVRFAYGLFSNAITGNGVIRYINCSGNNCHAGGFLSNNGPVKHFHKGGAYVLNGNSAPAWNLGGNNVFDVRRVRIEGQTAQIGVYVGTTRTRMRMEDCLIRNHGNNGGFWWQTGGQATLLGVKFANNVGCDILDYYGGLVSLHNCALDSTTEFTHQGGSQDVVIMSSKHDQTANNLKVLFDYATLVSDASVRHTPSGTALKFTITSTARGQYNPLAYPIGRIVLTSGTTKSISIWACRSSTNIQGQLRIRGGQIAGVPEQTVALTPTPADGATFVQSSSISVTPTEDGIIEIEVLVWDGTGTTNNLWVDDLTVT